MTHSIQSNEKHLTKLPSRILIVGSGGREHALCHSIAQSPAKPIIFCAPGNGGTLQLATNVPIKADDVAGIVQFAQSNHIDFVIVGPEVPLILGLADQLRAIDIPVFGPSQAASQLEASKAFSKHFMQSNHIPTATYHTYTTFNEAVSSIGDTFPIVIKASGVAAGKGVVIASTRMEAEATLHAWMNERTLGDAGNEIVIEQFLTGEEASLFVVTDGEAFQILAPVQDHKQLLEQDRGPNTGGMGTCAPSPLLTDEIIEKSIFTIIEPTLSAMRKAGTPFQGVLFIGLMICNNEPYVLEYNVRFGDPETQSLLPLLSCDLLELLYAASTSQLLLFQSSRSWIASDWHSLTKPEAALCVVLAARGYPTSPELGAPISLPDVSSNVHYFHAGTRMSDASLIVTGGRVLGITAVASSIDQATKAVYSAASQVQFEGKHYRRDIGAKMSKPTSRNSGARLTILGSSSGMPSTTRATSAYWLESAGNGYLFDCGEGTASSILKHQILVDNLRAIFITHTHPDHVAGLSMVLQMLHLQGRTAPLSIYLPSDKVEIFTHYLHSLYLLPGRFSFAFTLFGIENSIFQDDAISVETFPTTHLEKYREVALPLNIQCNSFGVRVRVADRLWVYPSDLPDLFSVQEHLRDADLLLIETTHIDPATTAKFASDHHIPRVVLTHISPEKEQQLEHWKSLGVQHTIPLFDVAHDGMSVEF